MAVDSDSGKTTLGIKRSTRRTVRILAALYGMDQSTVIENAVIAYARANAAEFHEALGIEPQPVQPPASWRRTA